MPAKGSLRSSSAGRRVSRGAELSRARERVVREVVRGGSVGHDRGVLRRLSTSGVLGVAAMGAMGCAFPDYGFPGGAGGDGGLDAHGDAAAEVPEVGPSDVTEETEPLPDPTKCAVSDPVVACDTIRELRAPDGQVIDGRGAEFCEIPPRVFALREGKRVTPKGATAPETASIRFGVSAKGVHLFVQVLGDPMLITADDPRQGDAVELLVRGTKDPITGSLLTDEAKHIVVAPPTATRGPDAREVLPGGGYVAFRDAAARRVRGGYEVELVLSWSILKNQPAVAAEMAFDVAIDVKDDPTTIGRELQSFLWWQPIPPSATTTCTDKSDPDPSCDDRTWCYAYAYSSPP
jgi:hypothetical protein